LKKRIVDFAQFFLARIDNASSPDLELLNGEIKRVENYLENFLQGNPRVDTSDLDLPAIRWPIEETSFIKLVLNRDRYYQELRTIFDEYLAANHLDCDPKLLDEVFRYQKSRVVNPSGPVESVLALNYNLPQFFEAAMLLTPIELQKQKVTMTVVENYKYEHVQDFVRFHVWYGRQGKKFYYQVHYDSSEHAASEFRPTDIHSPVPTIST
jgi:hypothetical protein